MAAGVEIHINHILSGNALFFESQGECDCVFGDYDFHDTMALPAINIITCVVSAGKVTVQIPLTSGLKIQFKCAQPGEVEDDEYAITKIFDEDVVGADTYECNEFVRDKILRKLGWY